MSEWINTKDRLPVAGRYVVVAINGQYGIALRELDSATDAGYYWEVDGDQEYAGDEITLWMPLPEMPK